MKRKKKLLKNGIKEYNKLIINKKGDIKVTREERKLWYYEQTHEIIEGIPHKQCRICKNWFPDTDKYFYWRNKNKTEKGLTSECKICANKRTQKRKKENAKEYKESQKKWRNKENNRNILNERSKKWRKNNPERKRVYFVNYQKMNPDKMAEYNKRRLHKNHKISKTEWENCKKYFNYECAYCGLSIREHYITYKGEIKLGDFHKEHAIHNGENNLSNCIPSCKSCNDQKWVYDLDEWYNPGNIKFVQERYDKIIKWLMEDHLNYIEEQRQKRKYKKRNINKM